jgi:hypothetical protein
MPERTCRLQGAVGAVHTVVQVTYPVALDVLAKPERGAQRAAGSDPAQCLGRGLSRQSTN